MFHRIAGVWVLVLAACCGAAFSVPAAGAPAADALGYVVRLARAAKVGDAAWFVADVTVVDSVAANVSGNDRNLKPEGVALHFEADERIEAVGARGEPTRATYRIEKCVLRGGKREILLLDPGTVLTVDAGRWKSALRVDRGHLRVKEEMALRVLVSLPNLGDVGADDVFGTREPRKVGESWPANPEALAKWASREGFVVDKKSVSGTLKLKGLQTVNGVPCLLVTGRAVVEPWAPDPKDVPAGMKLVSGRNEYKFTKLVPVDPAGGLCLMDTHSERGALKVRTEEDAIDVDMLVDVKRLKTVGIKRTQARPSGVAWGAE